MGIGGTENDSRKSFSFTDDKRDEATLPLIIKIVSDCWKACVNLDKHGNIHATVNSDGERINKIEAPWDKMKVALRTNGRRNHHDAFCGAKFRFYTHRG